MNRIYELRKQCGISQTSLGKAIGAAQNTISNWEKGNREPDFDMIHKLADYFGVTVDYLLGREDQAKKESPAPPVESEADLARKKLYSMLEGMNEDQLEKLLAIIDLIAGT